MLCSTRSRELSVELPNALFVLGFNEMKNRERTSQNNLFDYLIRVITIYKVLKCNRRKFDMRVV